MLFYIIFDAFIIYFFVILVIIIFYLDSFTEFKNSLLISYKLINTSEVKYFNGSDFSDNGSPTVLDTHLPFLDTFSNTKLSTFCNVMVDATNSRFSFVTNYILLDKINENNSDTSYTDKKILNKEPIDENIEPVSFTVFNEDKKFSTSKVYIPIEKISKNDGTESWNINLADTYNGNAKEVLDPNSNELFVAVASTLNEVHVWLPLKKNSEWVIFHRENDYTPKTSWFTDTGDRFNWINNEHFRINNPIGHYHWLKHQKELDSKIPFCKTVTSWLDSLKEMGRDSITSPRIWLFLKEVHNISYYSEFWGENDDPAILAERKRISNKYKSVKLQKGLWKLKQH